jgi:hypothetical protein
MQDRLGGLMVLGTPEAGTMVQGKCQITLLLLQPGAQRLGKKGMIAVPLALAIQRYNEEIGLLESFQHLLAVSLLHDSITE